MVDISGQFEEGDKVKIADSTTKRGWIEKMYNTAGKIGKIRYVGHEDVYVKFPNGDAWWYHKEDIIKLEE
jgi:hypothetical protein